MLEALVAVGLAGNVVQFVQFTATFVSEAAEIRKNGRPSSLPSLKEQTEALVKQAQVITARLKASSNVLAQEDQNLLDVATQCETSGTNLLDYLNKFEVQQASSNPLRHAQASFKFRFSHDKIEDFVRKLDRFRNSLILSTVLALRSSSAGVNDEVLAHLKSLHDGNHNLQADNSSILHALQLLVDFVQVHSGPRLENIQGQIQDCVKQLSGLLFKVGTSREDAILQWLNFRHMDLRYEEIDPAYHATFEWVFHEPELTHAWDCLTAYLKGVDVSPVYFVNGKAGSGKSTLMKFVARHPKTEGAVKSWAGESEYMVLSFFFWNVGNPLQKSYVGLLRALLYKVLLKYPELIPAVFPALYHCNLKERDEEPYYAELKIAFELLVQKSAAFLKLCILIDGIDEFEGDHRDLSLFLRNLSSPKIKIIASSRPINPCMNAFQGCASAQLQDLTRNDMNVFVRSELSSHPLMQELLGFDITSTSARSLMENIETKAEGVFLWVKLVVRMLVDGLEAGDDIEDLQRTLAGIPTGLKDLYRAMFRQRPPQYRLQANAMFRVFSEWNEITNGTPPSALAFSHAIRPINEAFESDTIYQQHEHIEIELKKITARIRSRCCGLLEVRKVVRLSTVDTGKIVYFESSQVAYLHKTVAEFLSSNDVRDDICESTDAAGLQPVLNIASASLAMMKRVRSFEDDALHIYLSLLAKACRRSTMSDHMIQSYLEDADRTMQRRWLASPRARNYITTETVAKTWHWSSALNDAGPPHLCSIHTIAARFGLLRYIRKGIPYHAHDKDHRSAIVLQAQSSWFHSDWYYSSYAFRVDGLKSITLGGDQGNHLLDISLEDRSATLSHLLVYAAKPETMFGSQTIWSYAVAGIEETMQNEHQQATIELAELLRIYLSLAKDPWKLIHDPEMRRPNDHIKVDSLIELIIEQLRHDSENEMLVAELKRLCLQESETPKKEG